MRKNFLGVIFLSIFSISAFGQTIQILDEDKKPIDGVFIFHDDQAYTAFTNEKGKADISKFPKYGHFHFQHISFEDTTITADNLAKTNYKVFLVGKLVWFNELVVAANKWEQEEKDLSQSILTVSRKEIEFNNPSTSADLLSQSGQVFVQKSQLGGGSPKLRGFSANSVLLVVDGVRMNNAIYRSGNLQNVINIDPNALSSSEVVFGPGSVIYGSDALGGVMDFHTMSPRWSSDGFIVDGNVMTRYGSAANEQTGHIDLSLRNRNWTYFGSLTHSNFNDLRAGSNRSNHYKGYFLRPNYVRRINGEDALVKNDDHNVQIGSGYDLTNTINKIKVRIGETSDLTYGFYYSTTSNIPRYDRLVITKNETDSLEHAEWNYGPQTWMMHSLQYNSYSKTKLYDQSRITVAIQDYEESRIDRDFGSESRRIRSEKLDLYSINIDLDKSISKGDLFYGFEYAFNDVNSDGYRIDINTGIETPTSTRYPDGGSSYETFAFYGNWIRNLHPKWTLNLGSRFSYINLKAQTTNENQALSDFDHISLKNQAINGMIGIVHLPKEHTKMSLTLSSGFRAPNIDDVGKIFEFDHDKNDQELIVTPNPDLKPEYAYNQEFSYSRKFEKVTINAVLFNTILNNPIIRDVYELNGSNTVDLEDITYEIRAQVNGNWAHIFGGSFQFKMDFSRKTQAYGSVSYSDGRESSTKEPLRHTTPVFGKVGLKLSGEKWRNEIAIDFNGNRWRKDIPSSEIDDKPYLYTENGSPGWYIVNWKSNFQASPILSISASIENIMDTHYRPYSSGISAPGRNFILGLRASF